MSLEIRKSSSWWYGVFKVKGKRSVINLGVPITGKRPPKRTMLGDDEFERSRGRAMEAYRRVRKDALEKRTAEKELLKLVQIKTGKEADFPKLKKLPELWRNIPRRKPPGDHYVSQCTSILKRFVDFAVGAQPGIKEFVEVTQETASAFMESEETRGVSASTWNYALELLRTTFRRLHPKLPDGNNPFCVFVSKSVDTVSRVPFTAEELKLIQQECTKDEFIGPVIITGMCTAMRRGDCCCLKWSDVDLGEGFISVKTSKTGEKVDIPIFPLLREELMRVQSLNLDSDYCFPKAAEMYQANADGISVRVKALLARAFEQKENNNIISEQGESDVSQIRNACVDYIGKVPTPQKAERMLQVLNIYLKGDSIDAIVSVTGIGQGTVSAYLNELEREANVQIVRRLKRSNGFGRLNIERKKGLRRASIRDFHSFRVTWITLALAAGVPLELVQRVTGHRTVEVVMKHYFRPGREDFREAILKAMPKMLSNDPGRSSPKAEMLSILDKMSAKSWRSDRGRLIQLLGNV